MQDYASSEYFRIYLKQKNLRGNFFPRLNSKLGAYDKCTLEMELCRRQRVPSGPR